jgi:hypothetical protein
MAASMAVLEALIQTKSVFIFAVPRGAQDEESDEIPEEDGDDNVEQDGRDLLLIFEEEITAAGDDVRVGFAATLIGDREKTQQGGEEQSAGEEALEDGGKMLARRGFGDGCEGPAQIEIDQHARREREERADEVRDDQIMLIRQR